jgi:ribonuclease R
MIDASTEFLEGRMDHVNVRFGFVVVEGREGDILVNARDMNGAIDGDIVKVLVATKKKKSTDKTEGEVIEIVRRGRSEIVGTIEIMPNYAFVVASSKKIYGDIFVSKNDLKNAQHGDKVIVKITKYAEDERKMEGIVAEVLGKSGENNTEMHAILAEFGLPISFPVNIEKEADNIPTKISLSEIKKRRDFRKITTFTIDPVDAKDFDDALSFEFLENGNYEIGVHIADVTHYVTPESALEQEAFMRATSVYLVDRVVPMLPEKLSNGLCSLRPNEDKLTFSAVFEVTPQAKVVKEWFGRTVIHSDKRFSYEEAQEQLTIDNGQLIIDSDEADNSISQITNNYQKELNILNQLAHKMRDERFAKGAVNFETVEVKFQLDEDGKPLGVYQKVRVDAHKLIEEFMLLANKKVAEYVFNLKKTEPRNTMVYRTHDAPDPEKLKNFSTFAKRFGYNVDTEVDRISASFNELMHNVEGKI